MKTSLAQLELVKTVKDLRWNGHGRKSHPRKMDRIWRNIMKRHNISGRLIIYGVQQNIIRQITIYKRIWNHLMTTMQQKIYLPQIPMQLHLHRKWKQFYRYTSFSHISFSPEQSCRKKYNKSLQKSFMETLSRYNDYSDVYFLKHSQKKCFEQWGRLYMK